MEASGRQPTGRDRRAAYAVVIVVLLGFLVWLLSQMAPQAVLEGSTIIWIAIGIFVTLGGAAIVYLVISGGRVPTGGEDQEADPRP